MKHYTFFLRRVSRITKKSQKRRDASIDVSKYTPRADLSSQRSSSASVASRNFWRGLSAASYIFACMRGGCREGARWEISRAEEANAQLPGRSRLRVFAITT
ncbi:uncharacterized protein LOC143184408 [Calliopsis andreniformis]|uniref:uncharacterized protein LOC143184408 n=1 Tax=Calliopsis andreniformis TaxID=337506 RepID=UPI003FCD6BCE